MPLTAETMLSQALFVDLKIYAAGTSDEAEEALQIFGDTWRKQYPSCARR